MECNKDEAQRAVEIAQRKLGLKDLEGARKFAVKAQQLYPPLPALSQLMPILDVLLAAHHTVNGEMDWYAILQLHDINVMADDSLVKKQYRKLALLLHPDKNKIVGSDSAFKLIVEAWGVLSDKIRRAIYDQKRKANPPLKTHPQNPKKPPQKRAPPKRKPPANGSSNGIPNNTTSTVAPNPPQQKKSINFWTVCHYCGMQYEYPRVYENKNLLCRNCQKPFLAVEAAAIPISAMSNFNPSCHPWPFVPMGLNNSAGGFGMGVGGFPNGAIPNLNFMWGGPYVGANAAAANSTAEIVNKNSKNVVGSEKDPIDESHNQNLPEKEDEYDVLIKKAHRQKAPSATKPSTSSSPKVPSSSKAPVFPKPPFFTKAASSPKDTPPKPSSSPKVPSSTKASLPPKVSAKKRKFDDSDQGSEDEVNGRKSHCSRKDIDLNKLDVEVVHSEASKEQPKKLFSEFAFTSTLSASKTDKPSGKQTRPTLLKDCSAKSVRDLLSKTDKPSSKQTPPTLLKDCSAKSVRDLLVEKAKMEILKNLSEVKRNAEKAAAADLEALAAAAKEEALAAAAKEEALAAVAARKKEAEDELRKAYFSAKSPDKVKKCAKIEKKETQNKVKKPVSYKKKYKKQEEVKNFENVEKPALDSQSITVPDSDFYDFDKDRTENCFETNQIWATYDDENGMPRFYARIVRVVSLNPFKVQMNWIEPKLNKYQTCGDFTVGKVISNNMLNMYSHLMKWDKSPKGIFTITPRKSDVWALYREWHSTWDENTPLEIRHKYEIVEVLTDFTEELGVSVVPLVKVPGFRNIFHKRQVASQSAVERVVPKTELLKFSHQVPARRLTEEDSPNIPEGCWELDPAATPLDILFQETAEAEQKGHRVGENIAEASDEIGGKNEEKTRETKTKMAEFEIRI